MLRDLVAQRPDKEYSVDSKAGLFVLLQAVLFTFLFLF